MISIYFSDRKFVPDHSGDTICFTVSTVFICNPSHQQKFTIVLIFYINLTIFRIQLVTPGTNVYCTSTHAKHW